VLVTVGLLIAVQPARAWGPQGHQLIGAVAEDLLNPGAKARVHALLGYDLATAGKWADCVRNVVRGSDGTFRYVINPRHQAPCRAFMARDERARMEDYARRNRDRCHQPLQEIASAARPTGEDCAGTYHYTDIALQRDEYGPSWGSSEHDVVHAVEAAIAVLQERPAPQPFSIADKKEALLLLAHFVGDIHQPLHVGALYLDGDAELIDPDSSTPELAKRAETRGGNWISLSRTENLHSVWDAIPQSWNLSRLTPRKRESWDGEARNEPPPEGEIGAWPAAWASETIEAARQTYDGLQLRPDPATGHWLALSLDPSRFARTRRAIQRVQIGRAAARLADVLNTVWPE
jgi:hypothetical protein